MPRYTHTLGPRRYVFDDLKTLLARASPLKLGDQLAGIAAAILDGLLYGAGDAVIGINPVSDSLQ